MAKVTCAKGAGRKRIRCAMCGGKEKENEKSAGQAKRRYSRITDGGGGGETSSGCRIVGK